MDSLTQMVLGAAAGEAVLGKKVGNKAPLWGAVAGTIPDLDVLSNLFLSEIDSLAFHRGMTHSILFSVLFAPVLGWIIWRFYLHRNKNRGLPIDGDGTANWRGWSWLAFWALFTHPVLDCFTSWGTQLFWPFSDYRVAWNTIFVVDPLYTLPFLTFLLLAMFKARENRWRQALNWTGIVISTMYLGMTIINKSKVDQFFAQAFADQNIQVSRFETKPTPLNNVLWFALGETEEGYYMGYYSLLDKSLQAKFAKFDKGHELLEPWTADEDLSTLKWMSKGYYTVEKAERGYNLYDLRFGSKSGIDIPEPDFVFGYEVKPEEERGKKELVIRQKEPDFKNTGEGISLLWQRAKGI